jgi:uncharacterized protein (DUF302 family)
MIHRFIGSYHVHECARTFDEVVRILEAATGSVENQVFGHEVMAATSPSDFKERMHTHESTSGFMRFHTIDHGAWMAELGSGRNAKMYTIGNPLIAETMIKHDMGVGLNVPVRIAVYEEPSTGKVYVSYNLPSSLMSALDNEDVTNAARALDMKLIKLAEEASGTKA